MTNTISAPSNSCSISSRLSSAARRPISGFPPEPNPFVSFSPIRMRCGALESIKACESVLTAMELYALNVCLNHAIDCILSAATDSDNLYLGKIVYEL